MPHMWSISLDEFLSYVLIPRNPPLCGSKYHDGEDDYDNDRAHLID